MSTEERAKPPEERPGPARGLWPGRALRGELRAPASKSIALRALLCAALADGETEIEGLAEAEDVRAGLSLVRSLGVEVRGRDAGSCAVRGTPPGRDGGLRAKGPLDCGESGTLASLALSVLALCGRAGERFELDARGSLRGRARPALARALQSVGAEVSSAWPLVVRPARVPAAEVILASPGSSQEVSALLLALAAFERPCAVAVRGSIPSRPYVDLTVAVLARFGARVESQREADAERFHVQGPLRAPPAVLEVEPDASLGAVALAAGCLSGGGVTALGLHAASIQGDVRIAEHLRAFGCRAEFTPRGLRAQGRPARGAALDLAGEPDLAPPLAAVAAAAALAGHGSELRGLGTLPGKESSRIEVLARGLRAAGWPCESGADFLRLLPARAVASAPVELDPAGDHRMAFAFALLGLARPGVRVANPGCVAKTWPAFWSDLEALGAGAAG